MASAQADFAAERQEMIEEIRRLEHVVAPEDARLEPCVLEAMGKVARHEFVPSAQRYAAYRNRPLSIGSGQTISQPLIVALMTSLLAPKVSDTVLEIGTGSGYQAAVLGELVKDVYSIEIVEGLSLSAAATLKRLNYANVHTRIGDGYRGWPEHAPFDSIIVTAAPDHVPPELIGQLKLGGRLVIPVGRLTQDLLVVTKNKDGTTTRKEVVPVRFVPLTRERD
jgi:protein-L-isoaspartate(D-aspartate) O-methyltransferase